MIEMNYTRPTPVGWKGKNILYATLSSIRDRHIILEKNSLSIRDRHIILEKNKVFLYATSITNQKKKQSLSIRDLHNISEKIKTFYTRPPYHTRKNKSLSIRDLHARIIKKEMTCHYVTNLRTEA